MIGAATLVTTETFNSNDCGLYPLFTEDNEVIGTQIIFGSKSDKRIYELRNPCDKN